MTVAGVATWVAASAAWANTVHFEAESVRDRQRGTITSPLLIKDDPAASGGSYLTVAAGTNSPSSGPASTTEGVVRYTFSVSDTATYRIWARVSAPTNADDSFWVRMGAGGSWIRWNGIPLGGAYHWVLVKAEGAANPATFALTAGTDNELQVAYREDGARLDAFFVTSDTTFDPNAAPAGPPALPNLQPSVSGTTAVKVSWSAVPGAASYTVERKPSGCSFNPDTQCCESEMPFQPIRTGLTVHQFTDATGGAFVYRVTAVGPTGASVHPLSQGPDNCFPFDPSEGFGETSPFHLRTQHFTLSVTPPMTAGDGGVGAPPGTNSRKAPPSRGRARLDFETALPTTLKVWADVFAPSANQDSFWVRVDDGSWFNWNNIRGCDDVHDSSRRGQPPVHFSVAPGSHRIEWAYREGGARLDNVIVLTEDLGTSEQCSD
jgi:hypothetical protein